MANWLGHERIYDKIFRIWHNFFCFCFFYIDYFLIVLVGALGGGIKALRFDLKNFFENNGLLEEIIAIMQRAVLMDGESIIRRVITGLFQGEDIE